MPMPFPHVQDTKRQFMVALSWSLCHDPSPAGPLVLRGGATFLEGRRPASAQPPPLVTRRNVHLLPICYPSEMRTYTSKTRTLRWQIRSKVSCDAADATAILSHCPGRLRFPHGTTQVCAVAFRNPSCDACGEVDSGLIDRG
jgi:hypothetical protein